MSPISYINISQTIENFVATEETTYTIDRLDSESYILSLPDSLTHNITMSPGQNYLFNLPCRVDDFTTNFTACDISDTTVPSWVAIN